MSLDEKRAFTAQRMRATLAAYEFRGYDVSRSSAARRVIMCRVAEQLTEHGILCLILSNTHYLVFP